MATIDPKFMKFNTIIGGLCAEARRDIWSVDPLAEFEIEGVIYKKPMKPETFPSVACNNSSQSIFNNPQLQPIHYQINNENQSELRYNNSLSLINNSFNLNNVITSSDMLLS